MAMHNEPLSGALVWRGTWLGSVTMHRSTGRALRLHAIQRIDLLTARGSGVTIIFGPPRQTFARYIIRVTFAPPPLPFWALGPPALPGLPMASYATGTWRRPPGRPRNNWLDQLRNYSTRPTGELWRRAVDRGHGGATTRQPSPATRP